MPRAKRAAPPAEAAEGAPAAAPAAAAAEEGGGGAGAAAAAADAPAAAPAAKKARAPRSKASAAAAPAEEGGAGDAGAAAAAAPAAAADTPAAAPAAKKRGKAAAPAAAAAAPKQRKGALPPHACAGPDPAAFSALPFEPAASMEAFTAALPARAPAPALKVLVYNVNGLRSVLREERRAELLAWLAAEDPDVLCLQEVKADAAAVAKEGLASAFPSLPHAYFASGDEAAAGFKKGYAGVAVYSKAPALSVARGLGSAAHDAEGRVLTLRFEWGTLVNVYVPNSGQKLERLAYRTEQFDPALRAHLAGLAAPAAEGGAGSAGGGGGGAVLCVGDFNVAHQNCDVDGFKLYRNKVAGFCDAEREQFAALLGAGFTDLWRAANPTTLQYTYYSVRSAASRAQNKGWRVDYALGANLQGAEVVQHSTWPKNDHVPFYVTLKQ